MKLPTVYSNITLIKATEILRSEIVVTGDYPVHENYWYIVDGNCIRSPISGYARDLLRIFDATEVRRCDCITRGIIDVF